MAKYTSWNRYERRRWNSRTAAAATPFSKYIQPCSNVLIVARGWNVKRRLHSSIIHIPPPPLPPHDFTFKTRAFKHQQNPLVVLYVYVRTCIYHLFRFHKSSLAEIAGFYVYTYVPGSTLLRYGKWYVYFCRASLYFAVNWGNWCLSEICC